MSDGPDLLERMRMCVADVGYRPGAIMDPTHEQRSRGVDFVYDVDELPSRVAWMASSIADPAPSGDHLCWACHPAHHGPVRDELWLEAQRRCLATLPCVEDCGVSR